MAKIKFTKTATQLLYAKNVGDTIVSFRIPGVPHLREVKAITFLVEHGFIRFLRQYSYTETTYTGRHLECKERHFEVLQRPDWMSQ